MQVEIRGYEVGEAMVRTGPFASYRGAIARFDLAQRVLTMAACIGSPFA